MRAFVRADGRACVELACSQDYIVPTLSASLPCRDLALWRVLSPVSKGESMGRLSKHDSGGDGFAGRQDRWMDLCLGRDGLRLGCERSLVMVGTRYVVREIHRKGRSEAG